MRFLTVVLLVALAAGAGWAWLVGPYYLDAWKMEDVVGSAALMWAAQNEDRARVQLRDEMQRRTVGPYITPDLCTFYEDPGNVKVVDCSWYVDVDIPAMGPRRFRYRVMKSASPDGRLLIE